MFFVFPWVTDEHYLNLKGIFFEAENRIFDYPNFKRTNPSA